MEYIQPFILAPWEARIQVQVKDGNSNTGGYTDRDKFVS